MTGKQDQFACHFTSPSFSLVHISKWNMEVFSTELALSRTWIENNGSNEADNL